MRMKIGKWLLLVVMFLSFEVFGQGQTQYIKVNRENLRSEPNGKKIGEVLSGTRVEILESGQNWVKVQLTGWIWEKSLTPDPSLVEGFKVRASHILVETEADANRILVQLNQGSDFAELASQYSIDRASGPKGGDLGRFGRGDFRKDFEDTVFRLKVGEISGVVKTNLGFHIIKRTE